MFVLLPALWGSVVWWLSCWIRPIVSVALAEKGIFFVIVLLGLIVVLQK